MEAISAKVGDVVRIGTRRDRAVVVRVTNVLPEAGASVRIDRFTRQALKAFPHDEVTVQRIELPPASQVVLTPAIDIGNSHAEQLTHDVKKMLVERQMPVRPGMLLYVKLPDGLAGITYDVHAVSGFEGVVTAETQLFLAFDDNHEHDEEAGHTHEHQRRSERVLDTTYEDIGGLTDQIRAVRELIELPLVFPQLYYQLGVAPPRGVIFYGPPGTGKTLLARSVANEIHASFSYINGPEVVGTYSGQTEDNLRKVFSEATIDPPTIIFVDELDAIAPVRGAIGTLSDLRAVTQLLSLMDGLKRSEGVVVIGTTNRLEAIDPALRRAGRFDREVYFPTPTADAREQILRVHTREMPLTDDGVRALPEIARRAHGFVGADLMELSREAALAALRRSTSAFLEHPSLSAYPAASDLVVTETDFETALQRVHPSALRESLLSDPGVGWHDVGGLSRVKSRLRNLIEWPLKHPDAFASVGLASRLGVLLHGPPGTGKTLLAKAVASEAAINFIAIQGPELLSQWLGESEESVRRVFRTAQQVAPCIVFFDQLDAIAPRRVDPGIDGSRAPYRVVNQLLAELDGMQPRSQVIVLGATNDLSLVDPALLRPGRFGVHLALGLPDAADRAEILRIHLRGATLDRASDSEQLVDTLATRTSGFSGADLAFLCQSAKLHALQRTNFSSGVAITPDDFDAALGEMGGLVPENLA